MQAPRNMVRKQIMMQPYHIKKLKALAKSQNTSVSDIMRRAIDAFDPDSSCNSDESELLDRVHARVKEAIVDTIRTREKVMAALDELESRRTA